MANTADSDRELLNRCLAKQFGAWNDFVDRFLGLFYRVIHFTAYHRSVTLSPEDVEDLAAEILTQICANNYAVLRQFEGRSSLATYLTVIARRTCVHSLVKRNRKPKTVALPNGLPAKAKPDHVADASAETLDEIQHILAKLPPKVREAVRLFYLEGRSYEEISSRLNIPVNSLGPVLARAKAFLKKRVGQKPVQAKK